MGLGLVDVPAQVHEPEAVRQARQDRHGEPGPLSRPFLAVTIEIPRQLQQRGQIGSSRHHLVVDGDGADDLRQTPMLRPVEAQHTHHVGPVDMERLSQTRAIPAHRRIVRIRPVVAHMTEQIAIGIL
jgi:hypothetical protein